MVYYLNFGSLAGSKDDLLLSNLDLDVAIPVIFDVTRIPEAVDEIFFAKIIWVNEPLTV
jgi:hypothetical protein